MTHTKAPIVANAQPPITGEFRGADRTIAGSRSSRGFRDGPPENRRNRDRQSAVVNLCHGRPVPLGKGVRRRLDRQIDGNRPLQGQDRCWGLAAASASVTPAADRGSAGRRTLPGFFRRARWRRRSYQTSKPPQCRRNSIHSFRCSSSTPYAGVSRCLDSRQVLPRSQNDRLSSRCSWQVQFESLEHDAPSRVQTAMPSPCRSADRWDHLRRCTLSTRLSLRPASPSIAR